MSLELEITDHDLDIYDYDAGGEVLKFNGNVWVEGDIGKEYTLIVSGTHSYDDGTDLTIDYVIDTQTGDEYTSIDDIPVEDSNDDLIEMIKIETEYFLNDNLQDLIDEGEDDDYYDDYEDDEEWEDEDE